MMSETEMFAQRSQGQLKRSFKPLYVGKQRIRNSSARKKLLKEPINVQNIIE